jgi:prepilin-type N-terminal cleavage/methylation domain-containing protein
MMASSPPPFSVGISAPGRRAFTLVEMLVAMALFALLTVVLMYVSTATASVWIKGQQTVEVNQSARAALDLITRELSRANLSTSSENANTDSTLQFIQNPTLPISANRKANTDSLFWQAPLASTIKGGNSIVGYFIDSNYQLRRLCIQPDNTAYYFLPQGISPTPLWLNGSSNPNMGLAFADPSVCSTVADGALGLWIRCLDTEGNPIPYPKASSIPASIKFDTSTDPVKRRGIFGLPAAVEITFVLINSNALAKYGADLSTVAISPPVDESDAEYTRSIDSYVAALAAKGIRDARVFSTRIKLLNGSFKIAP